jgi:DNA-binding PucR family transcriptional regulator
VLGVLARDDADSARLRETVWAHLAAGSNVTAAAEALHLHRNTVQYRLAKAERVRGRAIGEDRLAVEVALLACRVLGSALLG